MHYYGNSKIRIMQNNSCDMKSYYLKFHQQVVFQKIIFQSLTFHYVSFAFSAFM